MASPSRVSGRVSGENGVRKSTNCADRREPACESRPAHKSPDTGQTQKSALSGDRVGEVRKSGFRDPAGTSGGRSIGFRRGVFWRLRRAFYRRFPAKTGARKLTNCADRREPAFESRPAHKSPDFGPTRISAISRGIVGGIRKSGSRDLVRASRGGGLLDSGGACSDVSAPRFTGDFRRKQGPEIDQLRRQAGSRI